MGATEKAPERQITGPYMDLYYVDFLFPVDTAKCTQLQENTFEIYEKNTNEILINIKNI